MGMMSIRKSVQKFFAPVVIILVIGMAVGLFYVGFPASQKESFGYKGPSAKVFGKVIPDSDYNDILVQYQQQSSQYPNSMSQADLRDQALTRAITELAFRIEVDKAGSKVNASGTEINNFIKEHWPKDEDLQQAMQQYGKASIGEFKKWLQEQFKFRNFIIQKSRELGVKVSKDDILEGVEKITISHILIETKDPNTNKVMRTDAQALQIANDLAKKVTMANFGDMAKQYSDDPGSKDKGGTYGPFTIDQFKRSGFVKEFVDGALALKTPGQISPPIKTQFGYHIIKLDDRSLPKGDDYQKQYHDAENNLIYSKSQEPTGPFSTWMQEINQKALQNTEIIDPGLKAYRSKMAKKFAEAAQEYQQALKRSYYKDKIEIYADASAVYSELKEPAQAIKVLKRAPADLVDTIDYQIAMAKVYQAQGQSQKAEAILTQYSNLHSGTDPEQHTRLKQQFTDWKMTAAADNEAKIIDAISKQETENRKKYEESLQQKPVGTQTTAQPISTPVASPAKK